MPRVSVVLPSYNHEQFVEDAVASVLSQSLDDLELVVVDDGSRDSSVERIRAVSDRRLVLHCQENQGAAAAINKGIELSDPAGEYLCILNSDDVFRRDWVRRCVELLDRRPEVGFCACRVEMFGQVSEARRKWYAGALAYYRESNDVERSLLRANFIVTTSNVFVRRRILKEVGGFRPLRYTHDLDFFLRLAASAGFELLEDELVRYRIHDSNTIAETQRDEGRLIYEFGWIVADRIRTRLADRPDPDALFGHVSRLALSLPLPESGAVALSLLALRASWEQQGCSPEQADARALELLDESSPALQAMLALDPDSRRKHIAGLEQSLADQCRINAEHLQSIEVQQGMIAEHIRRIKRQTQDIEAQQGMIAEHTRTIERQAQDIEHLSGVVQELLDSRYYRAGKALAEAKGLKGYARLPGRLLRIAREAREREARAATEAGG